MAKQDDPIVFDQGVHVHEVDGAKVTLVVPHDVRLSQIAPALARLDEAGKGAGDAQGAA